MNKVRVLKILVIVSVVLLLSSGLMVDVHGKDMKRRHRERRGSFEGLVFNNGRIILRINKDGSATIKSAKDGRVLVEKMRPVVEIKERNKWVNVRFNRIKIRERDHGKWHSVKIKMEHRGKIRVKVLLKYFEKRRFKGYKPLYPRLKIKFSKRVEYRVEWEYRGVNLEDIAIIDNGTGYLQAPCRSGHEAHIIYNGSANINASFREDQDILKGYTDKNLEMGLNWENSKDIYDVLEVRDDRGHTDIVIRPSKTSTYDGDGYLAYRAPIPDSGTGEGKDSDGDGLYDVTEESGWEITWYDAQGHKHTEHVTSDPNSTDTDGDGLSDYEEWKLGTNPLSVDTDGDGLSDYEEVKKLKTSPTRADTDGDGLTDYMEVHGWYVWSEGKWVSSDPNSKDTDWDGLTDYEEWKLDTDPRNMDTDSDGIIDKFDKYPTIKDDEKPEMDVPHIYASGGKWWIKNLYVEDNAGVAKVTVLYYVGDNLDDQWSSIIYASHAWINASVKDDVWDYIAGNKIKIIVTDINGNQVTYTYSHDLYTDLVSIWNKISKFVSGAIINAIKNLVSEYPDLAPLIALGWALGESLWSNSIGGLIDIVKDPGKFIDGIKSFINALKSNGVMNTITAVLDGIKKDIDSKVNTLVSYISDTTKRDKVRQECFDMFVVGEIIGFVVSMAIQPDGFPSGLSKFIEKLGSSGSKLAEAFGKIASTIEKMKSLLEDAKTLALGKLMEKSSALKAAVKELVQSGRMSEKTKDLMNRIARWFGFSATGPNKKPIDEIIKLVENGKDAKYVEDALEVVKDSQIAKDPEKLANFLRDWDVLGSKLGFSSELENENLARWMAAFQEVRSESPVGFIDDVQSKLGDVDGFGKLMGDFKSKFRSDEWKSLSSGDILKRTQSYEAEMRVAMLAEDKGWKVISIDINSPKKEIDEILRINNEIWYGEVKSDIPGGKLSSWLTTKSDAKNTLYKLMRDYKEASEVSWKYGGVKRLKLYLPEKYSGYRDEILEQISKYKGELGMNEWTIEVIFFGGM